MLFQLLLSHLGESVCYIAKYQLEDSWHFYYKKKQTKPKPTMKQISTSQGN